MSNAMPSIHADRTSLFKRIASPAFLQQAWRKVRANRGAPGGDAVSILAFERRLADNLDELSRNLLHRTYEPLPLRHVAVAKTGGGVRELAIPAVRDRVAQRAVLDAVEPAFESQFLDCSFAFRPGRSVQTAIQHMIVARAQGYEWTVDADIHDFFPSIDRRLVCAEFARTVNDPDIGRLVAQWLDAGVMNQPEDVPDGLAGRCRATLAEATLSVRDALGSLADEYVSERLDHPSVGLLPGDSVRGFDESDDGLEPIRTQASMRRKALVRKAVEGVVLTALTERAVLGRFLLPALGIGGAAAAALTFAPAVWKALQKRTEIQRGIPQGSPISPLLSNIHLHPFDVAVTTKGFRLIRYCDDFVVMCRSKTEAASALRAAGQALQSRKLGFHPEKTRIVGPDEPLAFLGFRFEPDGRVIPPAGLPGAVVQTISRTGAEAVRTTRRTAAGWLGKLASKVGGKS